MKLFTALFTVSTVLTLSGGYCRADESLFPGVHMTSTSDGAVVNTFTTGGPVEKKLRQCIVDKVGTKDSSGRASRDYRVEVPGHSITVDPNQVLHDEFDIDQWTTVASYSWGADRNVPEKNKFNSGAKENWNGAEILKRARQDKKLVRITKLDGVKSVGNFVDHYPNSIRFEITDRPIPANSSASTAIAEMYRACSQEKSSKSSAFAYDNRETKLIEAAALAQSQPAAVPEAAKVYDTESRKLPGLYYPPASGSADRSATLAR